MTISYTGDVANASSFGCFNKILFKWKGSVYKLIYKVTFYNYVCKGEDLKEKIFLVKEQKFTYYKDFYKHYNLALLKNQLKGLSHETDLAFDDLYD
jgi:hypothetical protein